MVIGCIKRSNLLNIAPTYNLWVAQKSSWQAVEGTGRDNRLRGIPPMLTGYLRIYILFGLGIYILAFLHFICPKVREYSVRVALS